jgi:hypothetical protein
MVELSSSDVLAILVSMGVTVVSRLDLVVKNVDLMLVLNQRGFAGATVNGCITGNRKTLHVIMINLK